jgi:hypothetical protein
MGFIKQLTDFFSRDKDPDAHREYVRCSRCGEKIAVRVDLGGELTPQFGEGEGAYYVRKGIVGSGKTRCFQTIEIELYFDTTKRRVSRYITGGEFITKEEFDARDEAS